jgi:hypothetical protein
LISKNAYINLIENIIFLHLNYGQKVINFEYIYYKWDKYYKKKFVFNSDKLT